MKELQAILKIYDTQIRIAEERAQKLKTNVNSFAAVVVQDIREFLKEMRNGDARVSFTEQGREMHVYFNQTTLFSIVVNVRSERVDIYACGSNIYSYEAKDESIWKNFAEGETRVQIRNSILTTFADCINERLKLEINSI